MKILAVALLCVWVGGAVAQEERAIDNFAGVGVRAMGMGGAFVGVADDFTAMYWNPAGLAQMQRREVAGVFLCAIAAPTIRFLTALRGEAS